MACVSSAAAVIAAKHRARMDAGFTVTLVESPTTPIIGVGEGTWPTLRSTLARIGVSETEFFRHCDAAFKQGARFAKWTTGAADDFYYHPLMLPQSFAQLNLAPHWLARDDGRSFCDAVCPQGRLCDDGLAPKTIATAEFEAVANYSYHLDAGKFATFLQKHCTEKLGVRHLLADVQDVCDRITILFRGKKMVEDEVRELVQVKDVTQISAKGLTPQQIEELKRYMSNNGMNADVTHPTTTLEDLFVRIVRENTPEGQSSVGSSPT